ncbi:hypothetical protein [Wenjunlia tyrosinilytica]|uniref:Uncharacterized protein n=1 Tax=Wenjunlia tyrosinilytica TaxID=1544741 RepID=A0A917ZTQ4_9ACTN|nr:hypothetical protein [Wenjunlia tyrosinilytica]GGO94592.1 hypothetical protein GCM10012280_49860 [Wenjunlia tyrosinilytica]
MLVARGAFEFVLIPGPFVFSLDDRKGARIIRRLGSHHCTVLELSTRGGMMPCPPTCAVEEIRR